MKAILKYNLKKEEEEFKAAINGVAYSRVLWELDQYLRQLYKYENQTVIEIERVREFISEKLIEEGLEL